MDRCVTRVDRAHEAAAIAALPAGQRATIVLRFLCGLSVEQTADALGVTTGTVKSQTARAPEALRGDPAVRPHGDARCRSAGDRRGLPNRTVSCSRPTRISPAAARPGSSSP